MTPTGVLELARAEPGKHLVHDLTRSLPCLQHDPCQLSEASSLLHYHSAVERQAPG